MQKENGWDMPDLFKTVVANELRGAILVKSPEKVQRLLGLSPDQIEQLKERVRNLTEDPDRAYEKAFRQTTSHLWKVYERHKDHGRMTEVEVEQAYARLKEHANEAMELHDDLMEWSSDEERELRATMSFARTTLTVAFKDASPKAEPKADPTSHQNWRHTQTGAVRDEAACVGEGAPHGPILAEAVPHLTVPQDDSTSYTRGDLKRAGLLNKNAAARPEPEPALEPEPGPATEPVSEPATDPEFLQAELAGHSAGSSDLLTFDVEMEDSARAVR
jgi:hypothetical protein